MIKTLGICLLMVALSVAQEYPVVVNVESRFGDVAATGSGAEFGQMLQDQFNAAPTDVAGYCAVPNAQFPLRNQNMCPGGSNKNILWFFDMQFADNAAADWDIQLGTDFGRGAAVYVDGVLTLARTDDMWWGGSNWNHQAVIKIKQNFSAGFHRIQIYGSEGCCDGPFNVRFSKWGGAYKTLSENSLKAQTDQFMMCMVLYTECNFQGDGEQVCSEDPDTNGMAVKSIFIPAGQQATLFTDVNYEGKYVTFTSNVECMDGPEFHDFLQAHNRTKFSQFSSIKNEKQSHKHHKKNLKIQN